MIPAGRTALCTADVAERRGTKTLSRLQAEQLPAPISRSGARTRIWDAAQIDAHLAGQQVPDLPEQEAPDDLFDEEESRHLLKNVIKPAAWHAYIAHGHAPAPDKVECGVPHWYRRTIVEWDANRPGAGAGAGRKKGSKDTGPRDRSADPRLARVRSRQDRVRAMLARDLETSAAAVAAAEDISERHALRILKELRAQPQ